MNLRRWRWTTPALAGVVACVLLLAGCATPPQVAQLQRDWPSKLPERVLLEQVPFYAQDDFLCGPATLAMVAQAAGSTATPEALTPQVYLPGRQGALQQEMLAATRRQGLVAYPLAPRLDALLAEVASGQPVLVLLNLSLPIRPMWHYAVVMGYDREQGEILMHSGTTPRMPVALSTFERMWARAEHWAFRVTPPQRLPVTADADGWAVAVAALERVNAGAAQTAYVAALDAWPRHRISLLGWGNTAYALGQREQAARAYEATTKAYPDFADAWHNLAQVRLELGRLPAARAAAREAVKLGGPRLAAYQTLLEKMESPKPR
jgi:tetratricopeptide (TPR) repeat protein